MKNQGRKDSSLLCATHRLSGGATPMAAARLRRLPVWLLPTLALLALAASLLWLPRAEPAQAQDGSRPTITAGPVITSSPASGDTYGKGEAIAVALTFSEAVTVEGEPRVRLDVGERKRWARYSSADGATLTFTYTVKGNDRDADGISIPRNAVKADDGTIEDGDGNAAKLKHPALADQAGHKVDGSPEEPAQPEPEPTPTPTPTPTPEPQPANNEPQFDDGESATRSVDENAAIGADVGGAITATDGDGDALAYVISGSDAFAIGASTGQITVAGALDHETQDSYTLTVSVSDGKDTLGEADASEDASITVTVSIGNVDEAGAVSLDSQTPQAGRPVSATLRDPDGGVSGETWSWAGSANGTDWTAIAGANARTYTPSADDAGKYLQATASYSDAQGAGKTASGATASAVVVPLPQITAGPVIVSSPGSGDTYGVDEAIVVAVTFSEAVTVTGQPRVRLAVGERQRWARYSGADGATLTFAYKVKRVDADPNGVSIGADQLGLNKGNITGADGNAAVLAHPALADQAGHKVDGSREAPAQGQQQPPANSPPQFAADITTTLSVDENTAIGSNVGDAIVATDADNDALTYALSGSDAFAIGAGTGQITVAAALDHETQASHSLTVTVSDARNASGEADATVDASITVAVNIGNVDEAGVVSLELETDPPQVGGQLRAVLLDPDIVAGDAAWTWARSADVGSPWQAIDGAAGASYTATEDDAGRYLRATASYADGHGSGKSAGAGTASPVLAPLPEGGDPQTTTTIWSATLTVDSSAAGTLGCSDGGFVDNCSSSLTNDAFTYAGVTYRVKVILLYSNNEMYLGFVDSAGVRMSGARMKTGLGGLTLNVGGVALAFDDSRISGNQLIWTFATHPGWTDGQEVSLTLTGTFSLPAKPTGFTADPGNAKVVLRWTDPKDSSITKYQYQQREGAGAWGTWLDIQGSGAASTGHTVTGLDNETAYGFRIRAVNLVGNGAQSDEATATLGPTFTVWSATLTVDADAAGMTFGCSDVDSTQNNCSSASVLTDNEFTYGGVTYTVDVFRWGQGNPTGISLSFSGTTTAQANIAALGSLILHAGNLEFDFVDATARGSDITWPHADQPWTDGQTVSLSMTAPLSLPAEPKGFTVTPGNAQVELAWTDPKDSSITKYQYQQKEGSGAWGTWQDIPGSGAATTSHRVTGLDNGTAYAFRIRAVNAAGDGAQSAEATATPLRTIIWSATLTVDLEGSFAGCDDLEASQANCSDTNVLTDNDFTYSGTYVVKSIWLVTSGSNTGRLALVLDKAVSQQLRNSLTLHVGASQLALSSASYNINASVVGDRATFESTGLTWTEGQKVSLWLTLSPPAEPKGFTVTPGNAQVELAWTDPKNPSITKYQYRQREGSSPVYGPWQDIPGSGAATTGHTVTGLDNGTGYGFVIRAVNAAGDGVRTLETHVTPLVTIIWSATLTVDQNGAYYGCDDDDTDQDDCSSSTALTDKNFVYKGSTYTINSLYWDSSKDELFLEPSGVTASQIAALRPLTLHVDGTPLAVNDAEVGNTGMTFDFDPSPDWTDGQKVSLWLTRPLRAADVNYRVTEVLCDEPTATGTRCYVPYNWRMIPRDGNDEPVVPAGKNFRLMFITTGGIAATSATVGPYDTFVQGKADDVDALKPLKDHFRALVSVSGTDAKANTKTGSGDLGRNAKIFWTNGVKVADGYADLYDGSWDYNGIDGQWPSTEVGGAITSVGWAVWTGSTASGSGWSNNRMGDNTVVYASPNVSGKEVGQNESRAKATVQGLYGMSPVLTVGQPP